jgi:hypothetical protein
VQHGQPVAVLLRQLIGDRAGAVRRVVVRDQDVQARQRQAEQLGHDYGQVGGLVVRRQYNGQRSRAPGLGQLDRVPDHGTFP